MFVKKIRITALILTLCMALSMAVSCKNDGDNGEGEKNPVLAQRQKYIDHLNEKYSDYKEMEYGLDITKKTDIVSICYSTWFNVVLGNNKKPPNITEILEKGEKTGRYNWGGETAFHYWAEPAIGYYRSDDAEVIRTHMTQLAEANVDFIIIDNTNMDKARTKQKSEWGRYVTAPCTVLLDTIVQMRSEGLKTPYVVFWSGSWSDTGWAVVNKTYDDFHSQEKWKDCFVYWNGKPFTLVTSMPNSEPERDVTVRKMFGLDENLPAESWSFLQHLNEPIKDKDGYTEQMCVCTAAQRSYMSKKSAQGREHGMFMYAQWYNAFQFRPKVVTITWWNEWAAQRIVIDGETHFTDNYNQEYSRDIEPMKGGHGDQYYQWMKQYVSAYKNLEECPILVDEGYESQAADEALRKYNTLIQE